MTFDWLAGSGALILRFRADSLGAAYARVPARAGEFVRPVTGSPREPLRACPRCSRPLIAGDDFAHVGCGPGRQRRGMGLR